MIDDDGLLLSLRLDYGLDKEKADQIYKVLAYLAVEWKDQEQIPKKAADTSFKILQTLSLWRQDVINIIKPFYIKILKVTIVLVTFF